MDKKTYYNSLMKEMIDSTIYRSSGCIYATANAFDDHQLGQHQDSECTYNRVVTACEGTDILKQQNLPNEWK